MADSTRKLLDFLTRRPRYRNLLELGEGVVGKVSAVFDTVLQRSVACKTLNPAHLDDTRIVQTFVNEMKLMGRLSHPGILSIYDALIDEKGRPAYVMTLAEGRHLQEVLQMKPGSADGVAVPVEQAVGIVIRLAETMTYAHDRGILHLDLKPENIMVGRYGEVLIMDWGAARVYDIEKYRRAVPLLEGKAEYTENPEESEDLFVGTPMYMSPEQLRDARDTLTPASDIFSVGVIFYQLLTGVHPFKGGSFGEISDRIGHEDPPPVHELNADIPHSLSRICSRMLEKDVARRYASFQEVREAVEDYQRSAVGFPTRVYEAGEVIFEEGDPGDFVCVVVSGSVGISVQAGRKSRTIARLGKGQPFGELAALTGNPRTATATALEPSEIRFIRKQDIAVEIDKLSPWVGSIVESLSNRFVEMNERVLKLEKR